MDLNTYRAIAEQASHQLGLITRAQLHGNDVSDKAIARMAGAMAIEPIGSRTFRLAGVSPSFDQRVMAACLDTGGVASHRTAAALHGLSGLAPSPDIEVTIVHHRRHSTSRIARVHSTTNLPPDDLVNVGPIPTTGVARTFLGLAALVPEVSSETIRTAIGDAVREHVP